MGVPMVGSGSCWVTLPVTRLPTEREASCDDAGSPRELQSPISSFSIGRGPKFLLFFDDSADDLRATILGYHCSRKHVTAIAVGLHLLGQAGRRRLSERRRSPAKHKKGGCYEASSSSRRNRRVGAACHGCCLRTADESKWLPWQWPRGHGRKLFQPEQHELWELRQL